MIKAITASTTKIYDKSLNIPSPGRIVKVLAYVHAYVPDHMAGAETTLHDLLRSLVAAGHQCSVLISRESPEPVIQQIYTVEGSDCLPVTSTSFSRTP